MNNKKEKLLIIVDTENINLELFVSKMIKLGKKYKDYEKEFILPFNNREDNENFKNKYINFITTFSNDVIVKEITNTTDNALDFYVSALIGSYLEGIQERKTKVLLISNDKDFELIESFYKKEAGIDIVLEKVNYNDRSNIFELNNRVSKEKDNKKVEKITDKKLLEKNTKYRVVKQYIKFYLNKYLPLVKRPQYQTLYSHINHVFIKVYKHDDNTEALVLRNYSLFYKKYKNKMNKTDFTEKNVLELFTDIKLYFYDNKLTYNLKQFLNEAK